METKQKFERFSDEEMDMGIPKKIKRTLIAFFAACAFDALIYGVALYEGSYVTYLVSGNTPYHGNYFAAPVIQANAIGAIAEATVFFLTITLCTVFVVSIVPAIYAISKGRRRIATPQ